MNTTINKYEVFLKVVEFGSLSQAAAYCNYSQSAVSQIIRSLEKELQVTLLTRSHAGVRLTSDGKSLTPYIEELARSFDLLYRKTREIHGIESGMVRIGTFSSISTHILVPILDDFRKEYPNIRIELHHGDNKTIEDAIGRGIVDLGFANLPVSKDFEAIPIYTDPFVIVMPEDHPLAKEEEISLEELSAEPVVLFEEATRKEAYGILLEHDIQADIHYQSSDDPSILAMIERGMGLGYMGRLILTDTPYRVIAKKTDPQHFRHIALAIKDRKMAPRTALLFLEYVEENIAKYTKPIYEKNHM